MLMLVNHCDEFRHGRGGEGSGSRAQTRELCKPEKALPETGSGAALRLGHDSGRLRIDGDRVQDSPSSVKDLDAPVSHVNSLEMVFCVLDTRECQQVKTLGDEDRSDCCVT